jgi:signal transduction histidine kinase
VAPARVALLARIALLAAAYVGLAKLGLGVATIGRSVTLVWPPSGLALAALLLGSTRLLPGVALGAFAANVTTPGVGVGVAAAIAVGNTLEAFVGAALVRHAPFRVELDRARDVVRFTVLGAVLAPVASATIGTLALHVAGLLPRGALVHAGSVWWVGDAMGALLVAPALMTWRAHGEDEPRRSALETLALAATLLAAALEALSHPHATRPYAVFPPLIWAALRFGPRGATTATLVVAGIAIGSTVTGHGAFVTSSLDADLTALHAFLASVALTGLFLGATAVERERAIRGREHFISIASHELRTPLAPLRLQVQRMLRRLRREPMSPESVVEGLVVIERQTNRLATLLEDVLDLTRLRIGRLSLALERVDLASLVDEVCASQHDAFARARCEVHVARSGDAVGQWDRVRLEQVVTNLIVNALKYGVGPIEIAVAGGPKAVAVTVRDHGPGVPQGDRERIFGRFEHAASDGTGRGLGLGLYIVREIVEAHGGQVSMSNPPDGGAAFRFELPVEPAKRARSSGAASAARTS